MVLPALLAIGGLGLVAGAANQLTENRERNSILEARAQEQAQQQAIEQEKLKLQQEQKNINKLTAIMNISKVPNPQVRKALAPLTLQILGIDKSDPAAKTFTDLITSEDKEAVGAVGTILRPIIQDPAQLDAAVTLLREKPEEAVNLLFKARNDPEKKRLLEAQIQATQARAGASSASAAASRSLAQERTERGKRQSEKSPFDIARTAALANSTMQRNLLTAAASGAKIPPEKLKEVGLNPELTQDEAKEILKINAGGGGSLLGSLFGDEGVPQSRREAKPQEGSASPKQESEDDIDAQIRAIEKEIEALGG